MKTNIIRAALIVLCAMTTAAVVHAQTFVGLRTGGLSLTTFGTNGTSSAPITITNLSGGDSIIDLDFRPANGLLYGLGSSGTLYTIALDGTAAIAAGPVYTPSMGGGATSPGTPNALDFNPAADRVRLYSSNGTANFRINIAANTLIDDGALTYIAGDPQDGMTPNLVAAAYINNDNDMGTGTTLYSIDAMFNTLVVHPAAGGPAFSMLQTQDTLTLMGAMIDFLASNTGFDVFTDGGTNTAYVSSGDTIYTVNLNMGQVGGVAGDLTTFTTVTGAGAGITDFAVVPEPSTYALMGVGLLALAAYRFRRSHRRA